MNLANTDFTSPFAWVPVHNSVSPVIGDENSFSVAVHYDSIPVPYNIRLLWHADMVHDNRVFVLSFWYMDKKYKFQHTVKEEWYGHVNPAAISHSLLMAFLKVTNHALQWHDVARRRLAVWWCEEAGSVTGYAGKMPMKDIDWILKDTDPKNLGEYMGTFVEDAGTEHWHESDLTPITVKDTAELDASFAAMALPGMNARVQFPCGCEKVYGDITPQIYDLVQHLNDRHKWTREKIADWLDELHDKGDVNLEFSPWGELDEEEKPDEEKVELDLDFFNL